MSATVSTKPVLEPVTQKLLDDIVAAGYPPIHTLSPTEAREALANFQAQPATLPPTSVEDTILTVGPTGSTPIRIVRPHGVVGPLPVVMYFHGGGWMLGDKETHDRLIREIAYGATAAVVFVDYDRTPEAKYPVANEQAYAATKYMAENGATHGLDGSRLAVAGDSAGANMAAVVALMAKERGGPRIDLQVMFYPVVDAATNTPSYTTFAEGYWLLAKAMIWFWDAYVPDLAARQQITVSPLNASLDELRGLPPAVIITSENDVLRDEGEAYARKLWLAGVPVAATRVLGTIHDFVMINQLADTPAVRAAINQATGSIRHAFGYTSSAAMSGSSPTALHAR